MQDIDELIAKHLTGEATATEEQAVTDWLTAAPDNRLHFEQLERLWQRAPAGHATPYPVDTEAALRKIKQQIHGPSTSQPNRLTGWKKWVIAAMLLLVAAAIYWIQQANAPKIEQLATATSTLRDTLVDGTFVSLNHNSGLTARFTQKERRVNMQGEAFFQVAHNANQPFIIEVQQLEVKVIGTVFNVDNLSDPDWVVVSVQEGKVQLNSAGQTAILTAGQEAKYNRNTGAITLSATPVDPYLAAYRDRLFDFKNTSLIEVVRALSKAYNTPIILKNKNLYNCQVKVRYNNESLERIFELLKDTFPIRIEQQNGQYIIDGEGCE